MKVFLITRPIQYVNVLNLPFNISKSVLLIQNTFSTANSIYEIAQSDSKRWDRVIVFTTNSSIFKWLFHNRRNIESFTTYSDLGIRWYMLFNLMPTGTEINIYEEGLATYSYHHLSGLKRVLYSILNKKRMSILYLGAFRRIHGIYVYDTMLHNQLIPDSYNKVYKFKYSLTELIKNEQLTLLQYNDEKLFQNQDVFLYLTNWEYNKEIENYLPDNPNYIKIIKPHPRLKIDDKIISKFNVLIEAKYLAEIVIAKLINEVNSIIIVHEGSTSMLHFIPNEKLTEICLPSETSKSYYIIKEKIITLSQNNR